MSNLKFEKIPKPVVSPHRTNTNAFSVFIKLTMRNHCLPSLFFLYISWPLLFDLIILDHHIHSVDSFLTGNFGGTGASRAFVTAAFTAGSSSPTTKQAAVAAESVEEASRILAEWDRFYNAESTLSSPLFVDESRESWSKDTIQRLKEQLPAAVILLNNKATQERQEDSVNGRCMLGICASSTQEGIATLKAWVTQLGLPRGLLHGMDKDGVPLDIQGGVYIKYNSGGVYSFADIRKSGLGFDALWKPGDALLEPYDGSYRGVYFQVELSDGEFRQYLVPLDTFTVD
jgi:hypothetical protein